MKSLLIFPFLYLYDVIVGALRVAKDTLSPSPKLKPILLRVPITLSSPTKRLILANLVSMTPGTIAIGEEDNGRILLVHSLYGDENPEALIREIQERYESVLHKLPSFSC